MSNLPDAVRAQVQQADQDWADLYGEGKVVNAPDPLDAFDEPPVEEHANQPDPDPDAQQAKEPDPKEPDPQPTPAPAKEAKPPEPDPWEHRYKVLKGKYDAEVPRLQQQLGQMTASIEALTRQVQELQQAKASIEHEATLKLTPEEESAFGKDLIELTRKVAQSEAERVKRELAGKLEQTESNVQTVSKTTEQVAYERFLSAVGQAVPDWEEVNARPDWLEWLGQDDPLLGTTRQAALDQASGARDARRVAALFNAFKATLPKPAAPTPKGPDTVQQQVAPRSQTVTPAQPSTSQKRFYTEADLKGLYAARRRGEYTNEQWAVISTEIDNAVAEGRVR